MKKKSVMEKNRNRCNFLDPYSIFSYRSLPDIGRGSFHETLPNCTKADHSCNIICVHSIDVQEKVGKRREGQEGVLRHVSRGRYVFASYE